MYEEPTTIHPVQRAGGIDLNEPRRPPDGAGIVWGAVFGSALLALGGLLAHILWRALA